MARRWVLIAINGGDDPVTKEMQARLAKLPGLVCCFANNLHRPKAGHELLFRPLPIGLPGPTTAPARFEEVLRRVSAEAVPWVQRDRRLLVAPMKMSSRIRRQYIRALSQPEFVGLVRLVEGRLALEDFLKLIAAHRCTLSPPGRGYDCFRTWQALSVGTIPFVTFDETFDQRLYTDTGPEYLPKPEDLTPQQLSALLDRQQDPSCHAARLEIAFWRQLWASL